jgi:Tryptophan halogenase
MKNAEDIHPLSPLPQGLLFHSMLKRESPAYINKCSFTLRNHDTALFRQTWERVVARHAILRRDYIAWLQNCALGRGRAVLAPVQCHYFLTQRNDTEFWRANQHELKKSASILETIETYKAGLPVSAVPMPVWPTTTTT